MKRQEAKTINQTFSLPLDVSHELHVYIKPGEMSRFVADAIRKDLQAKKEELRHAYLAANKDAGQKEAREDWETTIGDGLDEW